MTHQLRLDDLLARDIEVKWFEAVAVIQAVCRHAASGSAVTADFPSAHDIFLDAEGAVSARAFGVGAGAAAAAAHLLATMLKDDVPVRLRLIVTQATGGVGCSTVDEFCEAVSYFERPDGEQVLRGLFERAGRAPNRIPAPAREDAAAPVKPAPEPLTAAERLARRRRSRLAIGVTAIILASGLVSWLIVSRAGSTRLTAWISGSDRPAEADDPTLHVAESGTRRPERVRTDARNARATEMARVKPSTDTGSSRLRSARPATLLATSDVPRIARLTGAHDSFAASPLTPAMVFYSSVEIIAADASAGHDADEPVGARIYTSSDSAVTPPRSIYPKLPDEPLPGSRFTNQAVLELVIASTGLVEHVKLRTAPRNIHEFMIVSAAKAWQFEPARLDGQPVRFRQLIHFSMQ
jgi:hypothetical protein